MYINNFFNGLSSSIDLENIDSILEALIDIEPLKDAFYKLDGTLADNYLYNYFISWLGHYAQTKKHTLLSFFLGKESLDFICLDFIKFCFYNKIIMDKEKTLNSFKAHNKLSDDAVKQHLMKIPRRKTVNLLGFGLDEGTYEKELAQFLIDNNLCQNVILYGLDPYANKSEAVHYLTPEQLFVQKNLNFDLIIARWSLHHVALQNRWKNLIQCINHCSSSAHILFVEHGTLHKKLSPNKEKLYELLNATFDIIANIGLRPNYLMQTESKTEANFFIRYLTSKDYFTITNSISKPVLSQTIYDVGPHFPNQTIYSFCIK
ncbi:class I SAM-dependent methyltransferase [Rickettsiella endosymbiont of Dermanyssus gallinae]|uniref:class I SAM-dependent methyltransferase n=1 Tax=Rickettsiella endosymbiont of Dermanyssus gallinae TaxID=2856608 RepID=UPI001C52FF07|nr:class I SAM-dependent methyltransferase [Rickettsiella endosymbiont of Dermanyssus gallinae]